MIDIFNKRWHGIQGSTVGEGKYQINVVRVQTMDQGPWQALNEKEIEQLLQEHNKIVHQNSKPLPPKKVKAKKKARQ